MTNKTHIIYIFPDEFRQRAMGFRGEDPVITPNLDRFAAQSMEFSNAFSSYPVCSPYRAMLFSGQYPYSNGVIGNCNTSTTQFGVFLKTKQVCLTDVLSQNGYDCGYIGKWHIDAPEPKDMAYLEPRRKDGKIWDAFTPKHRRHGFNFWYSYGCNDRHYTPHYWYNDDRVEDERKINEWSAKHETDVAVEYIKNENGRHRDENKPFALFVAYNPPHMPFEQVPEQYRKLYEGKTAEELLTCPNAKLDRVAEEIPYSTRIDAETFHKTAREHVANYFAAVSGIDDQFGRILKAIEEKGLTEDTIVIFTSDHGEMMGSHRMMYKGLWYDESVKVPFLIRYPKKIKAGKSNNFINPPDIMPTLLELVGLEDKLPQGIEGVSVAQSMLDGTKQMNNEGYFINTMLNARGVNNGKYLFVVIRDSYENETNILYDLEKDPFQTCNVANAKEEKVKEMRLRLQEWLEHTNDIWLK